MKTAKAEGGMDMKTQMGIREMQAEMRRTGANPITILYAKANRTEFFLGRMGA